ncbi:MAG: hypothetical protein LBS95_01565 [Mycoplasmataceae bacterium]|nr:hypothetical protein [Mycoplasmataceae bacterium]
MEILSKGRAKRIKRKIFKGSWWRKYWITISYLLFCIYLAYISLSLVITLAYIDVNNLPNKIVKWFFIGEDKFGKFNNTLILLIATGVIFVVLFISFILFMIARSPKKVTADVIHLASLNKQYETDDELELALAEKVGMNKRKEKKLITEMIESQEKINKKRAKQLSREKKKLEGLIRKQKNKIVKKNKKKK